MAKTSEGRSYGYAWAPIGTKLQKDAMTLHEQQARIEAYAAAHGLPPPLHFVDPDIGENSPFNDREAARELFRRARRGDCLIIAQLDTAFPTMKEFLNTSTRWAEQGIDIHVTDFGGHPIDPRTLPGKAILAILAEARRFETKQWARTHNIVKRAATKA